MNVGISVNKVKTQAEMYFEITICNVVMGFVFKSSNVPVRCSSANNLMVKLGINTKYIYGANLKKGIKEDSPIFSRLKLPGITHKNIPVIIRNTTIVIKPIMELK